MEKFFRSPSAIILGLLTIASWFAKETIQDWFFDKVLHEAVIPHWGLVVEYGPPLGFAGVWLFLLLRQRNPTVEKPAEEKAKPSKTFAEMAEVMYPKNAKPIDRISVLDFYKMAEKSGFQLIGNATMALQLAREIQQAAFDGILRMWGRQHPNEPLKPIPSNHWEDFMLVWVSCFSFGPPDGQIKNFVDSIEGIRTQSSSGNILGYRDIHLDREQAAQLLVHMSEQRAMFGSI